MAWLCYYKTLLPLFEGVKYLYNILIKSIYKEHPTGCHKHGTFNTRLNKAVIQTIKTVKNEGGHLKPFQISLGQLHWNDTHSAKEC